MPPGIQLTLRVRKDILALEIAQYQSTGIEPGLKGFDCAD